MTNDKLVLPCALASRNGREHDDLTVETTSFAGGVGDCLALTVNDNMTSACVVLDKDRARELFNALGIWLHKH